jgi:hypothetical protein
MSEFFKTLLKGVIYIVLLPVIVAFLAIVFVYCVGVFLYQAIRNLIIFFAGGNPGGDLKEDVEAKRRLAERLYRPTETEPIQSEQSQTELVRPVDVDAQNEVVADTSSLPVMEEEQQPQAEEGGNDDGNIDETYRI